MVKNIQSVKYRNQCEDCALFLTRLYKYLEKKRENNEDIILRKIMNKVSSLS